MYLTDDFAAQAKERTKSKADDWWEIDNHVKEI